MPRPPKTLPLILAAALLAAACGGERYGPTRIVDGAPFENGTIKKIAFLGGDTLAPDIQNRIVDGLADRYMRVALPGSVYRRKAVLTQLGAVHVPLPDPRKFNKDAATFGPADPKFAQEVKEKLDVDAFYVVWVVEWSPPGEHSSGVATDDADLVDIRREVVAEIFEAGTGRELWHTHWWKGPEKARSRLVPAEAAEKAAEAAIQEAVELIWASFWIG